MDDKLQEDWLDARLREDAPYLDDAGFTSRMVQKLPARQVRRSYRVFILIGLTLVACVAAFWLAGGTNLLFDAFTNVAMLPVMWMWIYAAAAALLVMAGGLAAAMSRARGTSR